MTAAATAAAVLMEVDWPNHLRLHIGLWLLAGLFWLLTIWALRARPAPRRMMLWLWAIAVLVRLPGWLAPPHQSDDVYRYLWDGAVQMAGHNPYAGPPEAPVYNDVRRDHPEIFARINNRHLPTIYPPAAQHLFHLAARMSLLPGFSPLRAWKLLVGVADLLVLLLLVLLCRQSGADPRLAAIWGFSPLCGIELAENAHLDVLGILPLCGILMLWRRGPRRLWTWLGVGVLCGAAALVKPVALAVAPAVLRLPRSKALILLLGSILSVLLCMLPYAAVGRAMAGSLGEYGRRWRGNDGAYALLQTSADAIVARAYPPPYYEPWHRPALARLITGRDRDTVWPDELAGFAARAAVLFMLALTVIAAVRLRLGPARAALLVLLTYLLLTPTLHPWYILWALALCPLWPAAMAPSLALGALVPLGYVPLGEFLRGQPWFDPVWTRFIMHGLAWALVLRAVASYLRRRSD